MSDRDQQPNADVVHIGTRHVWGGAEPFGLSAADRRQHVYCIGKTGTGKSTLLRNMLLQDIYAGRGVGLIDPHGDLAEDIIDHVPSWRTDDVVYFNPADLEYPIGLNLLERVPQDHRHRVTSGIVSAMRSIWRESWGARLEYILANAIAALLDCENTSILGIQRMLVDSMYRHWVVKQIKDPVIRAFWRDEYERYDERFMREAIAPIQNKVGQLVMASPIRNVLGQVRRSIDPRFMMDHRRILIANLSKGLIGEDKANLLGSLLVTAFEVAAMERADVSQEKREDFFLVIDEFHNFTTDSFTSILSEARKYGLCLTLSHQYLDQVLPSVQRAVFGNVGTLISFRVGHADAEVMADECGARAPDDFSSLENFEILAKVISGSEIRGSSLPPFQLESGRRDCIRERSREKYGTKRDVVEGRIRRWLQGRS